MPGIDFDVIRREITGHLRLLITAQQQAPQTIGELPAAENPPLQCVLERGTRRILDPLLDEPAVSACGP